VSPVWDSAVRQQRLLGRENVISRMKTLAFIAVACAAPAFSQFDFKVDGSDVQIHSFASQGFFYSDNNNFLTMPTTSGSFAFTDFAANISAPVTDKFRVGAQVYDRNVGEFGNWIPSLDWAMGDYRFKDWFGVRAGKVKTVVGLYNDTQDMEFLHTWALLPQSLYPVDLRGDAIAHIGADIYGAVGVKKAGNLSYTLYGGKRPSDNTGGYVYGLESGGQYKISPGGYSGPVEGADLRWTTPVKGLLAGGSYMILDITTNGTDLLTNKPFHVITHKDHMASYYVQYVKGNLKFDGEYRREITDDQTTDANGILGPMDPSDERSGYVAIAYRISKWVEVGSYHSRYYADWRAIHSQNENHIFDQAVTVRLDLRSYLDLKIEGHFMNGTGDGVSTGLFYSADNPQGLRPTTNMLVLRLGYHL
jgi:hypothetical protein